MPWGPILWSLTSYCCSCARVGGRIRIAEASRVDASVDLCGRDRCVAEQLLDHSQVRPALEQVRGEAVSQRVRRDPGGQRRCADPEGEAASDVGVGEAAAALGEEERGLAGVAGKGVTGALAVALQRPLGGLADGQQALLRSLAEHAQ